MLVFSVFYPDLVLLILSLRTLSLDPVLPPMDERPTLLLTEVWSVPFLEAFESLL